jgi:hypothetical protein
LRWLSLQEIKSERADGAIRRELASREYAQPPERPSEWRVLVQSQMRANAIVILHIRTERVAQTLLAEDNNINKAFASDRADQPLRVPILPWRSSCEWIARQLTEPCGWRTAPRYLIRDCVYGEISNGVSARWGFVSDRLSRRIVSHAQP